ncbi:hypothetical protein LBMAG52_00510 [Planctomycetia bacterium]|nr:hypothetical protein LBMAG52_00510 [Planctomycetia bacterium]
MGADSRQSFQRTVFFEDSKHGRVSESVSILADEMPALREMRDTD